MSKSFVVDTNVPKTANRAVDMELIQDNELACVLACVEFIETLMTKKGSVVLDQGDEIFTEYRKQLAMKGQPGLGDGFMKWVHDHRFRWPDQDRVTIGPNGDSYDEFPDHPDLEYFDPSDRKFVAVANAHPRKPPIAQAVDVKWWGWRQALHECGIEVAFLCADYVEAKYRKKFDNVAEGS